MEVKLIKISIDSRVDVRIAGSRREGNRRGDLLHRLNLVLKRRDVRRATGEGRTVRRSGVDRVQIILGQKTRAELQVIIQVKRASSLKTSTEGCDSRSLGQFPHTLYAAKLPLNILSNLGTPSRATAVVIARVGRHVSSGTMVVMVLLLMVLLLMMTVEECRHGD